MSLIPLLLVARTFHSAQIPAGTRTDPGLTVWVWRLDARLERMPLLADGQVPNAYLTLPNLDVVDGFDSQEGPLRDGFAGRAFGWITIPNAGRYNFRLTCDDGATLSISGKQLLDTEAEGGFVAESGVDLKAGDLPIEVPFYEDQGNFKLRLEWRRPGDAEYSVIPASAFRTEAGQTPVVAPGPKRWFYGKDALAPGDKRPLEAVHPSMRLETIRPEGFQPQVGGMTFLPDGRLAVCTWDQEGAVYLISGLNGPAEGVKVSTFAEGLGEPLGIAVIAGDIWVTQKGEVTRLRDTDGDGVADRYDAMAGGWPASQNYHEFTFNLVPKGGKFYLSTSVPLRGGWTYYNPGSEQAYPIPNIPGSILELDPKTGAWSVFARGLRTPNGMGIGVDGELFVCDNQGSWLPCSKLIRVRRGGFYGHQGSPNGSELADPPALWLPHGEISNSPSQPVLISKGAYKGQMLFGDVTYGGIQRTNLEKVDGEYQGAVFRFSQGLEAGVNRLVWGPDGKLYVGGVGSNGNWNHHNHRFGLQRLAPTGVTPFEMHSIHALPDGFRIEFTKPADAKALAAISTYQLDSFRYRPTEFYGGTKQDQRTLRSTKVTPSRDGKSVTLQIPNLEPGTVVHFRLAGLQGAQQEPMWTTESWYTLNRIPQAPRPEPAWTNLFDGKSLTGWHQLGGKAQYRVQDGTIMGTTVKGTPNSFLATNRPYGDFELEYEVKVDPTLNSGVQIRSHSVPGFQSGRVHGYQIEIDPSKRAWSGGIYDEAGRGWLRDTEGDDRAKRAFRNGVWNQYRVRAVGDRIQTWVNGVPIADLKDPVAKYGFIALQVHSNAASGLPVQWRNIRLRDYGMPGIAPADAIALLAPDGKTYAWQTAGSDAPIGWKWTGDALRVEPGTGSIETREKFTDFRMHLEFRTGDNGKSGQDNGNSGVYLLKSYEIQILNSAPRGPAINECGAIYTQRAPDAAMAFPAGEWQAYDIQFRAPRFRNGKKVENARLTMYHNGVLVHRDVEISGPTGAGAAETPDARAILLQDHGNRVEFRNVWIQRANAS